MLRVRRCDWAGWREEPSASSGVGCEVLSGLIGTLQCACHFEVLRGFQKMLLGCFKISPCSVCPTQQKTGLPQNLRRGPFSFGKDTLEQIDGCGVVACQKAPMTPVELQ